MGAKKYLMVSFSAGQHIYGYGEWPALRSFKKCYKTAGSQSVNVYSSMHMPPQLEAAVRYCSYFSHMHALHATGSLFSIDQPFSGTPFRMIHRQFEIVKHFKKPLSSIGTHKNLPPHKIFMHLPPSFPSLM